MAKSKKHTCVHCNSPRASFVCSTCGRHICVLCVFVTVILGKWNFYCSESCAPYMVDAYKESYKESA